MALPLIEHDLRRPLANEVHARPFAGITAPARLSAIVLWTGEDGHGADHPHLCKLCARYNQPAPGAAEKYLHFDFGPFRLKWERHAEFTSYVFIREGDFDRPFDDPVTALVPEDWLADLPGRVMLAQHMALEARERDPSEVERLFNHHDVISSQVAGGRARFWTDLRIHGDGFGRLLVQAEGLGAQQAGRLMQRLREVETYRLAALMAFPLAQRIAPEALGMDQELAALTATMAERGPAGDPELLHRLTDLAARIEKLAAQSNYRFGAARAYYDIVNERLADLREARIEGFQTLSEFLGRRMSPAMRTCESVATRLERLSRRVSRATNLLRTRIDIALESQNRDLLASMNRRARLQLRLQETVEGLSVAAITYYAVGLLGYGFKALKEAGAPINVALATGAAVPVVLAAIWVGLRRVRKHLAGR